MENRLWPGRWETGDGRRQGLALVLKTSTESGFRLDCGRRGHPRTRKAVNLGPDNISGRPMASATDRSGRGGDNLDVREPSPRAPLSPHSYSPPFTCEGRSSRSARVGPPRSTHFGGWLDRDINVVMSTLFPGYVSNRASPPFQVAQHIYLCTGPIEADRTDRMTD
jgi:hypothetical protein